ncbi:MAG: hypothetical protein LBR88_10930, partial [Zoogloeaceae bacterium]|nr:hypothetical protein [Zoogloeaceae bacterium]
MAINSARFSSMCVLSNFAVRQARIIPERIQSRPFFACLPRAIALCILLVTGMAEEDGITVI